MICIDQAKLKLAQGQKYGALSENQTHQQWFANLAN